MIVSSFAEILSYVLWKTRRNTLPPLHVYTILEYLLLLNFYYSILKQFFSNRIFISLAVFGCLFFIFDSIFLESIYTYNSYGRSVEALVIIFLCMSWYVKLISEETVDHSLHRSLKFINSAFLIYFAGSVMLFSFANSISHLAAKFSLSLWVLHTLLVFILYTLIAIGLWKYRKH